MKSILRVQVESPTMTLFFFLRKYAEILKITQMTGYFYQTMPTILIGFLGEMLPFNKEGMFF
jgi:hypothetical protein